MTRDIYENMTVGDNMPKENTNAKNNIYTFIYCMI